MGYVEGNTVQLKGRVACEINTCDELIATEMVFENVLENLDPPEIAGVCNTPWSSCSFYIHEVNGVNEVNEDSALRGSGMEMKRLGFPQ